MTLHRFFLPPSGILGGQVEFPRNAAHQIRRVLRLQRGDRVIVLDNSGLEYVVRLETVAESVAGTIEERMPAAAEPSLQLTLYLGLLKAARLELVLQKCTEIGVTRFVPMRTERSVAGAPAAGKQQRFEAIVREAAEQSRRGRLPAIEATVPFADAVEEAVAAGPAIVLWEEERDVLLRDAPIPPPGKRLGLFVGPEGGFSGDEARLAVESGAVTATLGPRILRAETAAIAGAVLLLDRFPGS